MTWRSRSSISVNKYRFSCGGSNFNCHLGSNKCYAAGGKTTANNCKHECDIAEQYMDDKDLDNQDIAAATETKLFLKTGEANGVQDSNKERTYFSFAAKRGSVDNPCGLGSFSRIGGSLTTNDMGVHNDASVQQTDRSRFYGIYIR